MRRREPGTSERKDDPEGGHSQGKGLVTYGGKGDGETGVGSWPHTGWPGLGWVGGVGGSGRDGLEPPSLILGGKVSWAWL